MGTDTMTGENVVFPIYNEDGTSFNGLELKKSVYDSVVMSLGDNITGDVYYPSNTLAVTMKEYIICNGVKYTLVNPPVVVREGMVADNGDLKGMTKYSFTFYHPMYVLGNFPFTDVAVSNNEKKYLSQNNTFYWIGRLPDYVAKINKNLQGTEWICVISGNVTQEELTRLSDVLSFDKNTIAEALKTGYETWEVPYIIDTIGEGEPYYSEGKRFLIQFGLPTTEILVENEQHELVPFVFHFGQGVGLKNNSRTPRNNKIVTRIAGYGSEDNIQWGYPQIIWEGDPTWEYTINNDFTAANSYPIYDGIVNGQPTRLIKHPFTRSHLMPSIYRETVNKKVNPYADGYNPDIEIKDYYDADGTYENPIKIAEPSYEIHEFEKIKPELGEKSIVNAYPFDEKETLADFVKLDKFLVDLKHRAEGSIVDVERHLLFELYNKVLSATDWIISGGDDNTYWYDITLENDTDYSYVAYTSANMNFTATVQRVAQPTPAWNDDMDGDGNYKQSYFKITLPQLDFDVYACAAVTQEMSINMRGGACLGSTFKVQVDWDDYKRNFYDAEGNFLPEGEQRNLERYPNSKNGQITVVVQKDNETFGTLMPNIYQKPVAGDAFVILGIALPFTYITNAETRLDADMRQYMRDNNVYYYDYPLKFDEHFLVNHTNILAQIKNNVVVRFDYAGEEHALYIKHISIKYDNKPLPTYDITLTDDIEIVLNQIGQVTDEVSKLRLMLGGGGDNVVGGNYIRKDLDDTAYGFYRFIKGFQIGSRFTTGILGEGGVFRKDSDGTTYLETDKLYVRMRAYFDTVEVKKYLHSGGNRIASAAGGINCSRVEYINASGNVVTDPSQAVLFRCYFKANENDKTITNDFAIGDQAFCKETNVDVSEINQHGYWRLIVGRNANGVLTDAKEAWIDLSNRATETLTIDGTTYTHAGYQSGSDVPLAQDDISQLGNIYDTTRQGAIVEYVGGEDAPSYQIFQGINDFSLNGKNYISLGYSSQSGHAYMNVYGDAYIGTPPDTQESQQTYIRYNSQTKKLDIKASIDIQSPVVDGQVVKTLQQIFDGLQDQIDGNIDTWFYNGAPYPSEDNTDTPNLPYTQWTTDTDKINHEGDLYYDRATGYAYRFGFNTDTQEYEWFEIHDQDITEALRLAAEAKDAADDAEEHAASFDYIKVALENKTQVFGGLMLTSLIGLGQRDQSENFTMWSGINGIYNDLKYGGGVAAWYGGAMGDVEHQDQYPNVTRHPKTLFRMDGSGYVANGSISWDATGLTNVNVSSISAATINLGGKGVATQEWVGLNYISIAYFDRLFRAYNGDTLVNHNDITSTIDNIKAMFGFWTDFYLSALGNNSQITNGITLDLLSDVTINNPSTGQVLTYNGSRWVNQAISVGSTALSGLSDVLLSSPAANQFLVYDSSNSKWVNMAIKTINGQPIYGSGDISVGGGASGNYLPLSGGTVTGRTVFSKQGDAGGHSDNGAALIIGGTINQSHIEIDDNEIVSKTNTSTPDTLYLNWDSSDVYMTRDGSTCVGGERATYKFNVVGNAGIDSTLYVTDIRSNPYNSYTEGNTYGLLTCCPRDWGGVNSNEWAVGSDAFNGIIRAASTLYIYRSGTRYTNIDSAGGTFSGRVVINLDNDADAGDANSGSMRIGTANGNYLLLDGNEIVASSGSSAGTLYLQYNGGTIECGGGSNVSFNVTGNIYATGAITALSDARKKDITGEAGVTVEQIAHAPAVKFLWKDRKQRIDNQQVGTLAQYWRTVLPEVVSDKGGELSMQYGVTALVSAIITARKVVDHERRITELENENERLRKEIEQLRLNVA